MAERLLEYNIQANREYGPLPVYSYVIYLVKDGDVPEPPLVKRLPDGTEILRFYYGSIKLWEIPSEAIVNTGLSGLYPMLPLTRGGKRPEMLDTLVVAESQELLTIAYTLAGLVFRSEADRKMLKRRFAMLGEILRDSWVYREIMDEGRDEGLRQGLQQGLQQGIQQEREEFLQTLRSLLLGTLQTTFPDLVQLAIRRVPSMKDPAILQNVMLKLLTAKNVEEAKLILTSASTEPG